MGGARSGSSGLLIGLAAAAVVGLVCVMLFVPWSTSSGCGGNFPCEPNTSLNLIKVALIVVLSVVALAALFLALNSDRE